MIALDLFRGAGGWSVACQQLGIVDLGVEKMREANATAHAAGHAFAWDDVWEPTTPLRSGFVDGLIASPPCQTFSKAGKGAGTKALLTVTDAIHDDTWRDLAGLRELGTRVGDERTALVLTPLYYWFMLQPEWVAFEQVPTVLPVWEEMSHVMREHGYSTWTGLLHAEQYGVPQTRKRAFLIAHRERRWVGPPLPTHSKYHPRSPKRLDPGVKPWVSMAEALGWGLQERPSPTITGGGTETGGAEPIAKLARYTNRPDWVFNRPSTTIVGTFKPEIVAAPGYRTTVSRQNAENSVRVTVAEAGILQSFPADYPWQGCKTKQYLQVGNAVPPGLAQAVLRSAALDNSNAEDGAA